MKSTGNAIDGTFSEYAIAYVDHIIPIPDSIDSAAASPIMCAVSAKCLFLFFGLLPV